MTKTFTLITGATSSIGKEIARNRCKTDNLVLHGRNMDALSNLASELGSVKDIKVWCHDFKKIDELHRDFTQMLDIGGIKVSKVVHAAGYLKIMPFRALKLEDTLDIFSVNVFSIIEILRVLTCKAHKDNLESVVMMSAFFSKFGDRGNAVYSSSKGALNSLIKGLAVEFPHARFNAIILGAVRTKMTEHLFDASSDMNRFNRYVLGTGTTDHVSDAVDFLLSDNLWMTGQEIYLDGGASIA
jgi:3-oxoacyl-[acyl-carrier protein] reductase